MGETLAKDEKALDKLSKKLIGYSPSNIVDMVFLASENAYCELREVTKEDIEKAIIEGGFEKINEEEYLPKNKKQSKVINGFLGAHQG